MVLGSNIFGNTAKGFIVDLLSIKYPLTAKQIHLSIKKKGETISYQGIHKALLDLIKKGLIIENNKQYSLNFAWLSSLDKDSKKSLENYCIIEENFSLSHFNEIRKFDFSNFIAYKKFKIKIYRLLQKNYSKKMYFIHYNNFLLTPIVNLSDLHGKKEEYKKSSVTDLTFTKSNSYVDKYGINICKSDEMHAGQCKHILNSNHIFDFEMHICEDIIIFAFLDKKFITKINETISNDKKFNSKLANRLFDTCFENFPIKVVVFRDKKIAQSEIINAIKSFKNQKKSK